jgi:hypothetical protein
MLTQLCRVAQLYADARAKNDKPVFPDMANCPQNISTRKGLRRRPAKRMQPALGLIDFLIQIPKVVSLPPSPGFGATSQPWAD